MELVVEPPDNDYTGDKDYEGEGHIESIYA